MKKFFMLFLLFPLYVFSGFLPLGRAQGDMHELIGQTYVKREWILWLDDGSYWLIKPMEKRGQTWSEWFSSEEPKENQFDDSFYFDSTSWAKGAPIQVYEASSSVFSDYPYILNNVDTGGMAFAKIVCPNEQRLPKVEAAVPFFNNPITDITTISKTLCGEIRSIFVQQECWKLFAVGKNEATWSEWWNNVAPEQPDEQFIWQAGDWRDEDPVQIYAMDWPSCGAEYRKGCVLREAFLIENKRNGKLTYAMPIKVEALADLLLEHADRQYKNGYNEGHRVGKDEGLQWADKQYRYGHDEGYKKGYDEGYRKGYDKGYDEGYKVGKISCGNYHSHK